MFSGGAAFQLEATLDQARLRLQRMSAETPSAGRPTLRTVDDRIMALARSLPRARVAAWLAKSQQQAEAGQAGREHELEQEVARQVGGLADELDALTRDPQFAAAAEVLLGWRRRLLDHLPAGQRPPPRNVRELARPDPQDLGLEGRARPVDVSVTAPLIANGSLTLHDIVVHPELRGQGAGTAALQEVLAFADHSQLQIVADFMPADLGPAGADAADGLRGQLEPPAGLLAAAARWYHRHGFRVGDQPPECWRFRARMRRDPHGHATGPPAAPGR